MITKRAGIDFVYSSETALTLPPEYVLDTGLAVGEFSKTHDNGWTIIANIREDYYYWVNEFEAIHPKFGRVWGDFEKEVYADTEEGFENFYKDFPPEAWDYADI